MLTLNERERAAYISGNTELAACLAEMADAEDGVDDRSTEMAELEREVKSLQDQVDETEEERDRLEDRVEELESIVSLA